MSFILNIDTATETAHVSVAENGTLLQVLTNATQKDHAAFVQPAIEEVLKKIGINLPTIDAVAVTAGPGSYTGLRVGMASAKGICYAINKPLLTINTLAVMAKAGLQQNNSQNMFYCPMIDARRMEVFTAVYNNTLAEIVTPRAIILDENSFSDLLQEKQVLFFGSGTAKWKQKTTSTNSFFAEITHLPEAFAALSSMHYAEKQFADLAYTEPFYLKEFNNNI